jgi:hypothetical protein
MFTKRRMRNLAVVLILGALFGGGLFVWTHAAQPPGEKKPGRPSAKLLVRSQTPRILDQTTWDSPAETPESYRRYQKTQIAMLKSRTVVNLAIMYAEIRKSPLITTTKDPVGWILDRLKAEFLQDTEILEVSLDGVEPNEAARLVNAIARAYLEEAVNRDQRARTERHQRLKELSKTYADLGKTRREELRKLTTEDQSNPLPRETAKSIFEHLRLQDIQLRLGSAETAALLDRRKAGGSAGSEQGRMEIEQLTERLAVIKAQRQVLSEELSAVSAAAPKPRGVLELTELQEELKQFEETGGRINREVERLNLELTAPPRITLYELAAPPRANDERK